MSDSTPSPVPEQGAPTPPAPPASPAPAAKGGLPPLAWVGIGCAALLVLTLGGCSVVMFLLGKGAEKVATDSEFRDKLLSGVTGQQVTTAEDGSKITIRDPKTGTEMKMGSATTVPEGFPEAVPVYKDAEIKAASQMSTPKGAMYSVMSRSADPMSDIAAFYRKALTDAGYESYNESNIGGKIQILGFRKKDNKEATVTVTVTVSDEGGSNISLSVLEPKK